eukprot:gene16707-biopygen18815
MLAGGVPAPLLHSDCCKVSTPRHWPTMVPNYGFMVWTPGSAPEGDTIKSPGLILWVPGVSRRQLAFRSGFAGNCGELGVSLGRAGAGGAECKGQRTIEGISSAGGIRGLWRNSGSHVWDLIPERAVGVEVISAPRARGGGAYAPPAGAVVTAPLALPVLGVQWTEGVV